MLKSPWLYCIIAWVITIVLVAQDVFGTKSCSRSDVRTNWALNMNSSIERRVLSQGNQDGILEYIFHHIGTTNKYYIEFGFDSPSFESGVGPNTAHLHKHYSWTGLLMDGSHSNASINLHSEFITPETVVSLFDKYHVPLEPDYLSIDLDTTDLWIFRAITTSGKYRPRVISTEYNCNLPFKSSVAYPTSGMFWNGTKVMGSSFGAFNAVAKEAGYSVVYVLDCLDIFYVRSDLLARTTDVFPDDHWAPHTGLGLHAPATQDEVSKLMEYHTFIRTGNASLAQDAAQLQMAEQKVNLTIFDHLNKGLQDPSAPPQTATPNPQPAPPNSLSTDPSATDSTPNPQPTPPTTLSTDPSATDSTPKPQPAPPTTLSTDPSATDSTPDPQPAPPTTLSTDPSATTPDPDPQPAPPTTLSTDPSTESSITTVPSSPPSPIEDPVPSPDKDPSPIPSLTEATSPSTTGTPSPASGDFDASDESTSSSADSFRSSPSLSPPALPTDIPDADPLGTEGSDSNPVTNVLDHTDTPSGFTLDMSPTAPSTATETLDNVSLSDNNAPPTADTPPLSDGSTAATPDAPPLSDNSAIPTADAPSHSGDSTPPTADTPSLTNSTGGPDAAADTTPLTDSSSTSPPSPASSTPTPYSPSPRSPATAETQDKSADGTFDEVDSFDDDDSEPSTPAPTTSAAASPQKDTDTADPAPAANPDAPSTTDSTSEPTTANPTTSNPSTPEPTDPTIAANTSNPPGADPPGSEDAPPDSLSGLAKPSSDQPQARRSRFLLH